MKFSEMTYSRPDIEAVKLAFENLVKRLEAAESYEVAKAVFMEKEEQEKHIQTQETLAHLRHTIDTRDKFYDDEMNFWNSAMPELQEYAQKWTMAMLNSPFRAEFEKEFALKIDKIKYSINLM